MKIKRLIRLKVKAFRDAFVSSHIDQGLAFQIKALRDDRGWTQEDLASRLGLKSQSSVARFEDPSYGKLSISKIKDLAAVFDVGVLIKFVPYSRFLGEVEKLSPSALVAKKFDDELPLLEEDCEIIGYYRPGYAMEKFISLRTFPDDTSGESFDGFYTTKKEEISNFSVNKGNNHVKFEEHCS